VDSFSDAKIRDAELRALMQRIAIRLNDEFTERYPEEIVNRVTVRTRSDGTFVLDGQLPKGHFQNPANAAELDRKFVSLAEGVVTPERRDAIRQALGTIDEISDSAKLVDTLVWL
jgi:2-methylcitrate dehydratase PrpD